MANLAAAGRGLTGEEKQTILSKFGIGIVGGGFMARTWADCGAGDEQVRLSAVFGGRRAASLAADYDIAEEPSIEALLARPDIDAVVITSPPNVHAEQGIIAAGAGKHVLVEKPMTRTVEQAEQLLAACQAAGVTLAVVSQHRFRDSPRHARRLIDEGVIGDMRMIRLSGINEWWDFAAREDAWKLDPANMNVFHDWGSHACDLLRFFAGGRAVRVYAESRSYSGPPPDQSAMALYTFDNGVLANLWMTYEAPAPRFESAIRLMIIGSDGMLDIDSYSGVRLAKDGAWAHVYAQPAFDPLMPDDPVRLIAYRREFADFIEACRLGRTPAVSGHDGLATMRMLAATTASARTHKAVDI